MDLVHLRPLGISAVLIFAAASAARADDPVPPPPAPPEAAPAGDPARATTHYAEAFAKFPAWPDEDTESRAIQITRSGWGRNSGDLMEFLTKTRAAVDAVIAGSKCPPDQFEVTARRVAGPAPGEFEMTSRRIATLLLMHLQQAAYNAQHEEVSKLSVATLCYAADLARGGGFAGKVLEAETRHSVHSAVDMSLQIAPMEASFWSDFPPAWRAAVDRSPPFAAALDEESSVDPSVRRGEALRPPGRWDFDSYVGEVFQQMSALPESGRNGIIDGVVKQIDDLRAIAREALEKHQPLLVSDASSKLKRPDTIEKDTLTQAFASWHLTRFGAQFRAILVEETQARALRMQIAIKRYRREKEAWPKTVAELQPGYLKEIPEDPFDGQPLKYVLKSDSPLLYSAGPNGVDDEGALPFMEGGEVRGTDLIFRVPE